MIDKTDPSVAANVRINMPAIKDQAVADELTRFVDALDEGALQ